MSSQRSNALILFDTVIDAIRKRQSRTTFIKRNGLMILCLILLTLWTWGVSAVARHNAVVETTNSLTAKYDEEYAKKFEDYKKSLEDDSEAEPEWVKDMENNEIPHLAKLANWLRGRGLGDKQIETYLWSIPVRIDNADYPSTVYDVLVQPMQYEMFDESIKPTDEDKDISRKVMKKWHEGAYPNGLTKQHVYAVFTPTDSYLRNEYDPSSKTNYWRMP